MTSFLTEKNLVRNFFDALEASDSNQLEPVFEKYCASNIRWRGVYPFREQIGIEAVIKNFWIPLKFSLSSMQRRQDIFIAGSNKYGGDTWVMSMGNFMGLFDRSFLGIPPTGRIVNVRYAEFNCVRNAKIVETGLFIDLIGLMQLAGVDPLPQTTGQYFNYPGPRTHDGLKFENVPAQEGEKTLTLLDKMIDDLSELNNSGAMGCPPAVLEKTWHKDMIWYGPAGVGASYTIERYQKQHQLPFRSQLDDKRFEGHVCRFGEGDYACFFGWPNLSNSPIGGWLGMPGGSKNVSMQVVDVYRRDGDKLAENWVLIDLPYWLKQQGLDVLERMRSLQPSTMLEQ